jgi:membrane-associated phospholipid phosphatase
MLILHFTTFVMLILFFIFQCESLGAHWWLDTMAGVGLGMMNTFILFYLWNDLKSLVL